MKKIIRLGTRGSPLALIQAEEVRKKLLAIHPQFGAGGEIEIVPIRTTGDWRPEHKEQTFMEIGGNKGLFTKEIEEALQAGYIDMAVHSMKDVQTWLPSGLEIATVLDRTDPRDAFIGRNVHRLDELPAGAVVGTSSLRRQAQVLARRPDLKVVPLRGNVDTRLRKLADGEADATLLAVAGMIRLGVEDRISSVMDTDVMLPAAAQGALGIEIRRHDEETRNMLAPLNSNPTAYCVTAERALLKVLDGSCHTPIAALARLTAGNGMRLEALVAKPNGSAVIRLDREGTIDKAEELGTSLGEDMKRQMPLDFFAA